MNGFDFATIPLILVEYGLGLCVLLANPRRRVNQCFCLLSLFTGTWMLGLQIGFHGHSAGEVDFLIRLCTILGAFFPVGYNLIRLAIVDPDVTPRELAWRSRYWLAAYAASCLLSLTHWYMVSVSMPDATTAFSIPEPIYGTGFYLWAAYFLGALLIVCGLYVHDIRQTRGRQRIDLQFVFIGLACTLGAGLLLCILLPLALGNAKSTRLAPFCSVGLQALVAYGIATRQMLDVGAFFRRAIAYAVLCVFLGSLYCAVWLGVDLTLHPLNYHQPLLPSLMATLAIALAMAPSRNVLQRFVTQVIGNWHNIDPNYIFPETDAALRFVTTTHFVLRKFGRLCLRATGTEHITIYLLEDNHFQPTWSSRPSNAPSSLPVTSGLAMLLAGQHHPFYADNASHRQADPQLATAYHDLTSRHGSLAIGLYDKKALIGIVQFGEKLSGRIYDEDQQATLQVMVNRLAIALENASLYTRLQESKLHVETLVDQLLSGVLVIDENDRITVINREAARLLRIEPSPLGRGPECLPAILRDAVLATQQTGRPLRDQSITLEGPNARPVPVRFGCRTFGRDGTPTRSTFLILDDLTQMKRLEEQLRRSDRLSSLGTLSASVAHEIKNPLVAIKTFVQLLPERKHDDAFLDNFTQLIGGEVDRIDNIVNQLLSFSRASSPRFQKVNLHDILDNTLRLLRHDLNRHNIRCLRELHAPSSLVWADQQKLEQVILNLILNAQDAMPQGGQLTLFTSHRLSTDGTLELLLELHDDGTGLTTEVQQKAFDPFFTTKENGTGLGLSIVYGIITEHRGSIELKNGANRGACVQIRLPLYREQPDQQGIHP